HTSAPPEFSPLSLHDALPILGFADGETSIEDAFADLANRWPSARFTRNDARMAPLVSQIFNPSQWSAEQPVRVVLIGTDFEVKVDRKSTRLNSSHVKSSYAVL